MVNDGTTERYWLVNKRNYASAAKDNKIADICCDYDHKPMMESFFGFVMNKSILEIWSINCLFENFVNCTKLPNHNKLLLFNNRKAIEVTTYETEPLIQSILICKPCKQRQ